MKFNLKDEEIKYTKIFYTDIEGRELSTKAVIKKINNREIIACAKFQKNCYITVPQKISVSFVYSDGIYKTTTTLKSIENEEPYLFFIFETPQEVNYEQNREYFRINIAYNCTYLIKENGNYTEYKTKTIDLSANGVSIFLNQKLAVNPEEIVIFINNTPIQTKVKHIRTEAYNNAYKASFSFTTINEKNRNLISQTCIQKQLEQKRNTLR
jgi:c-di-GMP-binding flagellar brake protein YcgR